MSEELKTRLKDDKVYANLLTLLSTRNYQLLLKSFQDSGKRKSVFFKLQGKLTFNIDGKKVELVLGKDVFASAEEKFAKK